MMTQQVIDAKANDPWWPLALRNKGDRPAMPFHFWLFYHWQRQLARASEEGAPALPC